MATKSPQQKFWASLQKDRRLDQCWFWQGGVGSNGYGYICTPGKRKAAHRFSYELLVGPIPDGLFVCHRCDNPTCVNPAHLFLGTPRDNTWDAARKGRLKGRPQPNPDFTFADPRSFLDEITVKD